jgi:hypothetical protein
MREGAADERYQLALPALRGGYAPALSAETGDTTRDRIGRSYVGFYSERLRLR